MPNYVELPVRFESLGIPLKPGKYPIKLSDRRGVCVVSQEDVVNIQEHGGDKCDFWMSCHRPYGDPLYAFHIGKIVAQHDAKQLAPAA